MPEEMVSWGLIKMTRLQSNLELRNTYMRSVSVHLENRRQHTPFSLSLPLGVLFNKTPQLLDQHIIRSYFIDI